MEPILDPRASYAISVHMDLNNEGKLNRGDLITMERYDINLYIMMVQRFLNVQLIISLNMLL